MNDLPHWDSLLLIAEIESRCDIPFQEHCLADISLEGMAERNITIYQHVLIFEFTLTGEYCQKIYEYDPKEIKYGVLFKNGKINLNVIVKL